MFRKIAVFVLALAFVPGMAHADDASKLTKAQKLVSIMHMDRMMNQMMDGMKAQLPMILGSAMPSTDGMNGAQKKLIDEFQDKMFDMMKVQMQQMYVPKLADIYAKSLTEDEIDGMIAYYGSPSGQSVLEKMPTIMQNSAGAAQAMMGEVMPKIQSLAEEYGPKITAAGKGQPKS